MEPSDKSPLTSLIRQIEALDPPHRGRVITVQPAMLWRAQIYQTTAAEIEWKHRINVPYDPTGDIRLKYLLEWADIVEGTRRSFSHGIEATMRFLFMPREDFLSGKDLAAGETRTLAQGS